MKYWIVEVKHEVTGEWSTVATGNTKADIVDTVLFLVQQKAKYRVFEVEEDAEMAQQREVK